jgi:phenylalanyl-tRNA synthetase beta chain
MKVSISWLRQYVATDWSAQKIADHLTMVGLEVDSVSDRYDYLDTVRVGLVESVVPHAAADKLKVCTVRLGDETRQIVCGAPNVAAGQRVAAALPGTQLPNGMTLQKTVIRGVSSEGMICSQLELGLGEDASGVWVLDKGRLGQSLKEAYAFSDPVIEVDLTPNRGDCLSIMGIAREVGAIVRQPVCSPEMKKGCGIGRMGDFASVVLEAPELCPRYSAAVVTGVTIGPSPFWLQDRLRSVGLRPINNVVDITNFVMMELGQPLHAFDYQRLAGHRIVVKTAKEGQRFVTLDDKTRELADDTLLICDGEKPVAIAGVMGGQNSEIDSKTTDVLIESAHFNPSSVRKTAKRFGTGTDASHRFERGVDPEGVLRALERAADLMVDVCGGKRIEGCIDAYPNPVSPLKLKLSGDDCRTLLGIPLETDKMASLLKSVTFDVEPEGNDTLMVTVPTFRFDVTRPVDLMEEIARLNGYDQIPTRFPAMTHAPGRPSRSRLLRGKIRDFMIGVGFSETVNYSFNSADACETLSLLPDDVRRQQIRILNPLAEGQSVMRSSMVPGILGSALHNLSQQTRTLKLFEVGKVFMGQTREGLPNETEMLIGMWTGDRQTVKSWNEPQIPCDFYDLKGVVEGLLSTLGVSTLSFTAMESRLNPYYRPGYAATVKSGDVVLGGVGEIDLSVQQRLGLTQSVYVFELNLDALLNLVTENCSVVPVPKYPAIDRDITLIVPREIESADLVEWIQRNGEAWVESVRIFDLFEKEPIPKGKKSVSIRVIYRSQDRTLEDEMINTHHRLISERLVEAFHAALPG